MRNSFLQDNILQMHYFQQAQWQNIQTETEDKYFTKICTE